MIQRFAHRFVEIRPALEASFLASEPDGYLDILKRTIQLMALDDLDPERITEIDHGDYQGTLVFVVGEQGYQPGLYFGVTVGYGSCSGCDTFEDIRCCPDLERPRLFAEEAMHMVQGLTPVGREMDQ